MFKRPVYNQLIRRLQEPRRFIQVLAGARQTGKTTLVRQVLAELPGRHYYATADEPTIKDRIWLEQQWEIGRHHARDILQTPTVLVLDEIQKIPNWSDTVKWLWDDDTAKDRWLHVVILGSAPLLMQTGLAESLAGRFEVIPITHWSYAEMRDAFGWDLDKYIYYGGYPGAAPLIDEPHRWRRYILDSLIETTLSRDILLLKRVDKPALLRRLFELGCRYSGQILSYNKMLGQLQDAGNTTTLAHYLDLLNAAGLLAGLQKYAGQSVRRRASSPKFQVHDNALITAQKEASLSDMKANTAHWGRLVESTVGMWLINQAAGSNIHLHYWSEGNHEVDFVITFDDRIVAIEVKSSAVRPSPATGIRPFASQFKVERSLLVGAGGLPLDEFLTIPAKTWFE